MRSKSTLTMGAVALLAASVFLASATPANAIRWPWDDSTQSTAVASKEKKASTLPTEKPAKRKASQAGSAKTAKAPKAPAKKPAPASKAVANYPKAYSGPVEILDRTLEVGKFYQIKFPTFKAQRIVIVAPGITPADIHNPNQRYDVYGWTGQVLFTAHRDVEIESLELSPMISLLPKEPGWITGEVRVYSSALDKVGTSQPYRFLVKGAAKEAVLPPPPPAPAPTVQPLPAPAPIPPLPQPAKVVAKPKEWSVHAKGNQDFYSPGGAGTEYTDWELGVEKKFFDPERYGYSFVSTMVRAGGTPDSFGYFLPGTDDPTIQLSGHIGQQDKSGKDLLALGIGLNAETHFGRAGGFSKWPISVIGRAAKQFRFLGTRLDLESQADYNVPNYIGGKVGLEVGPADWPVGFVTDIAGVYIADTPTASSSALPRVGLNWHVSPDIEVSGRVGYNSRNSTLGIPSAAVTARF